MPAETVIDPKVKLLHYLCRGEENAIKKDNLARLSGRGERSLRLELRALLDDGIPVCGNARPPYGYFIVGCPEEIRGEMRLIRSYGKELFRRY